jgi:hypothetical protein
MAAVPPAGGLTLLLADEAATARLAEDIAPVVRPGDLIALSGGLGAGKSSFARALIRALAADPALEVPSPTFPIRIDHPLPRLKVVHADLYRLGGGGDLDEIGLDEALAEAALVVEWPETLPENFAANRLDIRFEFSGEGRRADLSGSGSWPTRLDRTFAIRKLLDGAGWPGARRVPLIGDASTRMYERIARGAATAILMNAPARPEGPSVYEGRSYDAIAHRALDVLPFIAIGEALQAARVRTPRMFAADPPAGLLLLEDLGSEGIVDASGAPIMPRYEAAIDLLASMHAKPWPETLPLPGDGTFRVPRYDRDALLIEISLFPDWFGGHGGEPAFPKARRPDFLAAWSQALQHVETGPKTLALRDFHSPNILWQEGATGTDRVGVLDFQDALIGHPAYDVASLAQDARVPLTPEQEEHLKSRYIAARCGHDPAFDAQSFDTAYAILAAQRATKVLGAFTRLALVDNKPGYSRHRARLKDLLRRTLGHPVLSGLRLWYEPYL